MPSLCLLKPTLHFWKEGSQKKSSKLFAMNFNTINQVMNSITNGFATIEAPIREAT